MTATGTISQWLEHRWPQAKVPGLSTGGDSQFSFRLYNFYEYYGELCYDAKWQKEHVNFQCKNSDRIIQNISMPESQ